jgi:hypothetical protein
MNKGSANIFLVVRGSTKNAAFTEFFVENKGVIFWAA